MKINTNDLERWRENTLEIGKRLKLEEHVLEKLKETQLKVVNEDNGKMFYGWVNFLDNTVSVYETNKSRYLPKQFREVWNQSGMDHELIGHLYNCYTGSNYNEENARRTQIEIAKYRGNDDKMWKLASWALPKVLKLKDSM